MNSLTSLTRQAESIFERLLEVYQVIDASPTADSRILPVVLKELGIIAETLQVSIRNLEQQHNQLLTLQSDLEAEKQRYRNLFDSIPEPCFITSSDFLVQEVNLGGALLLNLPIQQVKGKSLTDFIYFEGLSLLQTKISQLTSQNHIKLSVRLQRCPSNLYTATVSINIIRRQSGEVFYLQWLLSDIAEHEPSQAPLQAPEDDLSSDRSLFHFNKGETIPLDPNAIWLVSSGVAKLTTLSERGEDMLVGIVTETMVFGSNLTALPTYQAIALSEVKLILVPILEFSKSPSLGQIFLSSLRQRLQQTEKILDIYGQIRVEERLNKLLLLLKQVIGEPNSQGIRLRVRLTHQDFASACCTTRVTVTRLLGKLQEQGKLTYDSQNHLILKE